MTLIYAVRHAQTVVNVQGRFNSGTVDSPLTSEGVAQTEKLATVIRPMHFDRIIASPLPRTVRTAHILQGNDAPIMTDERFREVDLGDWNGGLADRYKNLPQYKAFDRDLSKFDSESIHAESIDHLVQRGISGLKSAAETVSPNDRVLLVSHGYILSIILHYITGIDLDETRAHGEMDNSAISVIENNNGRWSMVAWNIHSEDIPTLPVEQQKLFKN